MKTNAIVQARIGSTRLPGKVLADIHGCPMLQRVVERLQKCELLDEIVVATTTSEYDQPIVDFCRQNHWNCFRGSEEDVLSRYYLAARKFRSNAVARVTSDCPLIDPQIVDETIQLGTDIHAGNRVYDYTCNVWPDRKFPRGLDVEWISMATLSHVNKTATEPRFREHVTLAIYNNPFDYRIGSISSRTDYSHLRWTVDTAEDLRLVNEIYQHFGEKDFSWLDIIDQYRFSPQWKVINQEILQKAA